MKNFIIIIICALLSSCIAGRNTSYRVLNKNGKIVYLERKKPLYNNTIKENEKEIKNIENINKTVKNTSQNNKIVNVNENNKISDELLLDSSAYSLKSVVDTVVKDDDIEYLAKLIDKNKKSKTIKDFNIPEYYFNSNIAKQEQNTKTNVQNLNDLKTVEKIEKTEKTGFFARLFGKNNTNDTKVQQGDLTSKDNLTNKDSKNKTNKSEIVENKAIFNNNQKFGKQNTNYALNNTSPKIDNQLKVVDNSTKITNNTTTKSSNTTQTNTVIKTNNYLQKDKYYVQLGSFVDKSKADKLMKQFDDLGDGGNVVPIKVKNKIMYKVVVGTFSSNSTAKQEMNKILERGHFDCYIFKR